MSLETVAARAVEVALAAGASDAEAWAEEGTSCRIRVYSGEVESLSDAGGRGVGVRAFVEGRSGYAYGTDLTNAGVLKIGEAAREAAEVADPDEHAGLPEECGATPVEGLASSTFGEWSTERKVELALATERAARSRPGVTQVENAVYSDAEGSVALANSQGLRPPATRITQAWAYASAFAGEGADLMTGLGVDLGRDPEALDPGGNRHRGRRARARAGGRAPAPEPSLPVVLDAFVAASFIGFIGSMLSAEAVQRGRSLFAEHEGEEIAAPVLASGRRRHPTRAARRAAPSTARARRAGARCLIEGGRAAQLSSSTAAPRAGRVAGADIQRQPRVVSLAPLGGNDEPDPSTRAKPTSQGLFREAGEGLYVTGRGGPALGGEPRLRDGFSVRASGRLIRERRGRPARCASSPLPQ